MTSRNDDRITDKSRNVKLVLCFNASAIGITPSVSKQFDCLTVLILNNFFKFPFDSPPAPDAANGSCASKFQPFIASSNTQHILLYFSNFNEIFTISMQNTVLRLNSAFAKNNFSAGYKNHHCLENCAEQLPGYFVLWQM